MGKLVCESCGDDDDLYGCDFCGKVFCINHIKKSTQFDTHYCNDCNDLEDLEEEGS